MSVLSLEKAVPPTKKVSKALFSPKPIKQKSINESHESLLLASITFTQNKWNSLESISFDPLFLDKSKSLHFIPTFSCLDDFVYFINIF